MQINKIKKDMTEILSDVFDGATIMVGGFGEAGSPVELIHGLIDTKCKDLTIIANNAGNGKIGLGALIGENQVKKVICSFARSPKSITFKELYIISFSPYYNNLFRFAGRVFLKKYFCSSGLRVLRWSRFPNIIYNAEFL